MKQLSSFKLKKINCIQANDLVDLSLYKENIKNIAKKNAIEFFNFDFQETENLELAANQINNSSLFYPKRIFFLEHISYLSYLDSFLNNLFTSDDIFIFIATSKSNIDKIYKKIEKYIQKNSLETNLIELIYLEKNKIQNQANNLVNYLEKLNITLENINSFELEKYLKLNNLEFNNLKKILVFWENQKINKEIILAYIDLQQEGKPFSLLNYLTKKDLNSSLNEIKNISYQDQNSYILVNFLIAKEIIDTLEFSFGFNKKFPLYKQRQLRSNAQKFSKNKLVKILDLTAKLDIEFKNINKKDPWLFIKHLAFMFCVDEFNFSLDIS